MKFKISKIDIEGESISIRELSARQRQDLFGLYKAETNPIEIQANIIKMGCIGMEEKTTDEILDLPGGCFDEIAKGVLKISGLDEGSEEEAEKNS